MARGATATAEPERTETGLTLYRGERFLSLNDSEELRLAIDAAREVGEQLTPGDLIRVPTPAGGATRWTIPNPVKEEVADEITGILVFYQPCGILWPGTDPQPGAMPVLRTFQPTDPNGVAEQCGPIPDNMLDSLNKHKIADGPPATFKWANIPQNQWGSGKGGVGKMCKEQRMLFLLRENDIFPLLVTAQPGSVKNVSKFFKMLAPMAKVPYYRCVVTLKLEKANNKGGQPFSRIIPSLAGVLPSDVGAVVKEKWTEVLARIVRKIDAAAPEGTDEE